MLMLKNFSLCLGEVPIEHRMDTIIEIVVLISKYIRAFCVGIIDSDDMLTSSLNTEIDESIGF